MFRVYRGYRVIGFIESRAYFVSVFLENRVS